MTDSSFSSKPTPTRLFLRASRKGMWTGSRYPEALRAEAVAAFHEGTTAREFAALHKVSHNFMLRWVHTEGPHHAAGIEIARKRTGSDPLCQ